MKKIYAFLILAALLVLGLGQTQAQNSRRAARAAIRAKSREMSKFTVKRSFGKSKQFACVGAMLGASNYYGDLAPRSSKLSTSLALTRTYLGFYYSKRINANISWRASLAWARLRGDDYNANRNNMEGDLRYKRNLNFRNDVIEASMVGIVDILPTDRGYLRRDFFNGYGMLGLSIFYHNPKGYVPTGLGLANEGTWISLRPLGTEGQGLAGQKKKYSLIQPAIILGGGVKYRVGDKLDIGLEFGWRFTFTDYLDDVSGAGFLNDSIAAAAHAGDKLWFAMSNKSGLQNSSLGDGRSFDGPSGPVTYQHLDVASGTWLEGGGGPGDVRRIKDFRVINDPQKGVLPGSPRGLKALDGYTVTTLTATYILEFRARTPKFR